MAKPKKDAGGECLIANVDAADFAKALGHVSGAVARKDLIPILNCVMMDCRDGSMRLVTTNLDYESEDRVALAGTANQDGALCVDARALQALVSRMRGECLVVHNLADQSMSITAGRMRATLPVLPFSDFTPMDEDDTAVHLEVASGVMASGFSCTLHAASTEEQRYYLNGIYIERKDGDLCFTSTDGHRLAHIEVTAGIEDDFDPVIVPRHSLKDFIALAEWAAGEVRVSIGERLFSMAARGRQHTVKLIDGSYPDYGRVIPKDTLLNITLPVKEARQALELVVAASTERSSSVKIETEEGRALFSVSGMSGRRAEASVEHTDIAPGLTVGLNGKYLLQALALAGDEMSLEGHEIAEGERIFSFSEEAIAFIREAKRARRQERKQARAGGLS